MTIFQYQGRNRSGELISGEFEAGTENAVADYLLGQSITPVKISPGVKTGNLIESLESMLPGNKITMLDQIFFCRQMYSLLRAGVPIMDALEGLHGSTPNKTFAEIIGSLREGLNSGLDVTAALRRHPKVFSTLYCSIVEAGETSGNLEESFRELAVYLDKERENSARIRAAMRYPALVIGAIVIAMIILNIFVIPVFASMFEKFGADLPWATQFLIASSNFTLKYWYLILVAMVGAGFALRRYLSTPIGRRHLDRYKLKFPVMGKIIYNATLARFTHTIAINIKAGVPWGRTMEVVSAAVDNTYLSEIILRMKDGVESGDSVTNSAAATGLFPTLVLQMLKVGEETGSLETLLEEISEYYEREVDYQLKNLSSSIEPILLLVVGVMVLILALGVFLPMWDMGSAALGK